MILDQTIGTGKTGKSGIYVIMCLVNGKFYIGSSKLLRHRFRAHYNALQRGNHPNRHLQSSWNKHGEDNFAFSVLEYCDIDMLLKREQWYLDERRPFDRTIGYNNVPNAGNNIGMKLSPEVVEHIRQRQLGHIKSPETIEKFKQAWTHNHDEWQQKSIDDRGISFDIVSPDGILHHIKGLKRFAREHGLDRCQLARVVKGQGRDKSISGWHLPSHKLKEPFRFLGPDGQIVSVKHGALKPFCRERGLDNQRMLRIHRNPCNTFGLTHKGWTKYEETQ